MSRLTQSEVNALDSYVKDAPPDDVYLKPGYARLADALGSLAPQMLRDRGDLVREIDAGQVEAHNEEAEGDRMSGDRWDGQ